MSSDTIDQNGMLISLQSLLDVCPDEAAKAPLAKKFADSSIHMKALLKAVYDDKRFREKNEFADLIYRDHYSVDELNRRPFINFGPGHFRHKYWQTADKIYAENGGKLWSETRGKGFRETIDYTWDMYAHTPIAIEDGAMEIAYGSHIVEHAYDEDNAFFFKDVHRILRKGGVFRLTAPNIDLALRSARDRDYSYFGAAHFLRGAPHRERVLGAQEKRFPLEWYVVEHCSLLTNQENSTFLSPEECVQFLKDGDDVYETLTKASRLSDRSLNEKLAVHVNWFNLEKVTRMLKEAGFSEVIPSAYGQSVAPVLRDIRYFDNTAPHMSWYVDAVK